MGTTTTKASIEPRFDEAQLGALIGLLALFITALVTAQLTASKVLAFDIPLSLPITGSELILPGAALAYALTFLASDCVTELYGRRIATVMVNIGFLMNFVLLALVWSTIIAPAAEASVDPDAFELVLGASTNIVIASLIAYLVSQNFDVFFFDWLRTRTDGAHLWFRNITSTAMSQAIDTVIFVTLGFYLVPLVLGLGTVLPGDVVLQLIVGQYLLKLLIVGLDTPFVYAIVYGVRAWTDTPPPRPG